MFSTTRRLFLVLVALYAACPTVTADSQCLIDIMPCPSEDKRYCTSGFALTVDFLSQTGRGSDPDYITYSINIVQVHRPFDNQGVVNSSYVVAYNTEACGIELRLGCRYFITGFVSPSPFPDKLPTLSLVTCYSTLRWLGLTVDSPATLDMSKLDPKCEQPELWV